jgi:large subunit ribosomal protein L31e
MAKAPKTDIVSRDYTINLHKRLHGLVGKKRAPRAIKEVKKFASSAMNTKDVRIASSLNKALWAQGIKSVPVRIRVRLSRKRNEDEEKGGDKLYTLVEHVPLAPGETYKGLVNETVV